MISLSLDLLPHKSLFMRSDSRFLSIITFLSLSPSVIWVVSHPHLSSTCSLFLLSFILSQIQSLSSIVSLPVLLFFSCIFFSVERKCIVSGRSSFFSHSFHPNGRRKKKSHRDTWFGPFCSVIGFTFGSSFSVSFMHLSPVIHCSFSAARRSGICF